MPRTPVESRPEKTRTSVVEKRIARPRAVTIITSSCSSQIETFTRLTPSGSFIAILPFRFTLVKSDSRLRRTSPSEVAKTTCRRSHSSLGLVDLHQRGDADAGRDGQDVDDGLALRRPPAERQPPALEVVDHAVGGEEQKLRVGVGDEERRHHVVFLGRHRGEPLAAAALAAEFGERGALDVAARGDGHHHVLALDQILVLEVARPFRDLGAARHGEQVLHLAQLVRDDRHDPLARAEDVEIVADLRGEFGEFVGHFLHAHRRQALEAQVEDRAGLDLGEVVGAVLVDRVRRIVDQPDIVGNVGRRPAPRHQPLARLGRIGRAAYRGHHLVHVRDRDGEAAEDVAAFACLAQLIGRAARHHIPRGKSGSGSGNRAA